MEPKTRNILLCLLAAAITLLVFLPSLGNRFVTWIQFFIDFGIATHNQRVIFTDNLQQFLPCQTGL
jgi:hypothetical protein